jgi:hypothetical protein
LRLGDNTFAAMELWMRPERCPRCGRREPSEPDALQRVVQGTGEGDLIICLISGGGSALLTLPAEGITLEDVQTVTGLLLRAGATINELNAVRKHLSRVSGGQLARVAAPARVLSLILSDVTGSPLDTLNGGTGFSGAWSPTINGANYTIAAGSLAFAPLCTSGGRMHSPVGHTQMSRQLSASFGSDGTTRFFSFLLRPEGVLNGGDLGGFHGLQLQGDAGALFIGKPGGAGGGVLSPYVLEEVGGAGQVVSPVAPVIDETALLVVKAEFAAGNDVFTLYVNPTPGSPEPVTGAVKSDLDLGTSNSLLIYSGGEFSLDEIRVGETFESVTPRP